MSAGTAGARILAGSIRAAQRDDPRRPIWLSDMRGFTELADRIPPADLIELLNRYFRLPDPRDCEAWREVLKFMGDGSWRFFPLAAAADPRASAGCARAAAEVRDAVAALSDWPSAGRAFRRRAAYRRLLYGNIGRPPTA